MSAQGALRTMAALALAAAGTVRADVVLTGNHHTGDCDDAGLGCVGFTPLDPVSRNQMFNYPVNFTLTTTTTIDKVQLEGAVDLDGRFQAYVELRGTNLGSASSRSGTQSGSTFDFMPDLVLPPGEYVILPDGGCSESSGGTFFYNCPGGKVNDFGYSAVTLVSAQSGTTMMLNQRRHLGDNTDPSGDDDYDFSGTVSSSSNEFYPDAPDGTTIDISFTLDADLRLTQAKFYRLRDINNESPTNATNPKVLVNGTLIGELTTEGDPFPLTLANSLLLLAGSHTLRVESGSFSGQRDDFSWDDIVLVFADVSASGTPGRFNAVDTGAGAVAGSITTKVAGGVFTLDLYALNGFGTGQDSSHAGLATVHLLDASDSSGTVDVYGCNSQWSEVQSLGTATFAAGYAALAGTFPNAGLKEARIRVTDSATGAQGCSIDNFAIRPANFLVEPSHDSEETAGLTAALTNTGDSGLPRHKAGRPFTIVATARSASGATVTNYDGTPVVTPTAIAPATTHGALTVAWSTVSPGVLRTDSASYSDVGPVTIRLEDATWAGVDSDDTLPGTSTFSGEVGAGRFIPDHFKVTPGELAPACAAGDDDFSYLGDTLNWASAAVTLTAVAYDSTPADDSDNPTALNYEGTLAKLPATVDAPAYAVYDDPAIAGIPALDTTGLADPVAVGAAAGGSATIGLPALSFVRALVGAFDAEIGIEFPAFADSDGVAPTGGQVVLGTDTAGGGVAFTDGAKSQRFGRLYFVPAYGSELRPLVVTLRAEYFDGVTFRHNADDACTVLGQSNIKLTAIDGTDDGTTQSHLLNSAGNGLWTVEVSAPNPTDQGTATLAMDPASPPAGYAQLLADTDNDGTYAEDPTGIATFGLYAQQERWIHQREVVGD